MALSAFVGTLGAGKTLGLTWRAMIAHNQGKTLYSNYKLGFPHYTIDHPDQLEDIRNGFAALDELWLWMDSRASGDQKNMFRAKVLAKSRKRKIEIGYTAQNLMQIDKRIRNVTDTVYAPYLPHNPEKCLDCQFHPTRHYRHPLSGETMSFCGKPIPVVIEAYEMIGGNFGAVKFIGRTVVNAERIIPLYDTTEEVFEDDVDSDEEGDY